ncbi:unnamed protein product [Camellia sinensis]
MAASSSSLSPPSPQDLLALPAPPPPPSSTTSRRLPPPCWSHDETVALIDAYCDKWYSLRRGNLRANHWQEVAEDVANRCPVSAGNPPKTSVQCRHKMEKLRKRYRTEIQRSFSTPNHRFSSSWVHFKRMDCMEKGPSAVTVDASPIGVEANEEGNEDEDEDEDDDDEDLYRSVKNRRGYGNGIGSGSAFRIRIPGQSAPRTKMYSNNFDVKPHSNVDSNPNFVSTRVVRNGYSERLGLGNSSGGGGGGDGMGKKREGDPVAEIVTAINALRDGFVRMERVKMEMAREFEAMRMEMEMKRTEMILESQQRIVETFAKAFSEKRNKKPKRMPTPES